MTRKPEAIPSKGSRTSGAHPSTRQETTRTTSRLGRASSDERVVWVCLLPSAHARHTPIASSLLVTTCTSSSFGPSTMPRRFAGQVHKQTSRFLRSKLLKHEPAWYQAVLEHPPLPLPPRAPASRQRSFEDYPESDESTTRPYDLPQSIAFATIDPTIASSLSRKPLPIRYVEDKLRRQFFKDHPFEAFRPVSIIEKGRIDSEHPINGKQWTRLRQRGRNPTAEECAFYTYSLLLLV